MEFLPASEYPYGASWGYQVTGYYAPTHRYGSPKEFSQLISSIQDAGIGVIIDWVPAHFPSDEFALSRFDGTCLFEHEDPRRDSMLSGELFVIITVGLRFEAFNWQCDCMVGSIRH